MRFIIFVVIIVLIYYILINFKIPFFIFIIDQNINLLIKIIDYLTITIRY